MNGVGWRRGCHTSGHSQESFLGRPAAGHSAQFAHPAEEVEALRREVGSGDLPRVTRSVRSTHLCFYGAGGHQAADCRSSPVTPLPVALRTAGLDASPGRPPDRSAVSRHWPEEPGLRASSAQLQTLWSLFSHGGATKVDAFQADTFFSQKWKRCLPACLF